MSDIDEDLLALAGAGSADEVDDVEEEESDFYEPSLDDSKKRKAPSLSTKNKKTRKAFLDQDDDEDEENYEDDVRRDANENPYPLEGKYKNEKDKDELLAMDEMQREQILFERGQEMERYNESKYLALRAERDKIAEQGRLRSKRKGKDSTKADKREQLKAQRRKIETRRRGGDYEDDEEEDVEEEDEEDEEADYGDEDDFVEDDEERVEWATKSSSSIQDKEATLSDINKIRIGRTQFNKFCYYPEFTDVVVDCYARMNVGFNRTTGQNEYRMVKINDVVEMKDKVYLLTNHKTNLYLIVSIGKNTRKVPLNIFSDNHITKYEFDIYMKRIQQDGLKFATIKTVDRKYHELRDMSTRSLTDKEINEMIVKKQTIQQDVAGVNAIMRKTNLQAERAIALENGDLVKVEKIEQEINDLEQKYAAKQRTVESSSDSILSKVNEKNKKLNQELIREAELRAVEEKLKNNNTSSDPFSRLKTNTRIFYAADGSSNIINNDAGELTIEKLENESAEKQKLEKQRLTARFRDFNGGFDSRIKSLKFKFDVDIKI
ncbi:hypothetical protein PACTADRAFT_31250 [Pachysolen tannophilus NRRL Y-2460]|uniref:Plus3 domain-containing protein n=1 Tax=Pachysolen tannophilus NRRL Y-2460 TaxID=669874 RepID=A0A1E4U1E0_PACTA|nr:hypothetical protein PACTADRAFT_31250 [Pachysolen tannophilus NRRL Y-2460]